MIFAQTPLISPITQDQADVIQEEVRRLMDTVCMRVYAVATLPIAKLREVTHTNFGKPTRRHVCEIFDIPRAQAENQEDPLTHLVTEKVKSLDMFRWINVKWYGGLTVLGGLVGYKMHHTADQLNLSPNPAVFQILGLVFVFGNVGGRFRARVIERTDNFHELNRELRQWVSSMSLLINGDLVVDQSCETTRQEENVGQRENKESKKSTKGQRLTTHDAKTKKKGGKKESKNDESDATKNAKIINDYMLLLVTLAESFADPDSDDFKSFFHEPDKISITIITNHETSGQRGKVTLTGKVADYLAENIEELGIQEDTITNGDRIELLTRVKNQLVRHIQHFIRYHIEHGVQGDVYAEMSHIHGLVGRYDTNSTEGIKAPEWIFLALAVMYGSVAFYLPEDHPGNTIMALALLGYFGAMMRDYYYGNSGPTAIDPRDWPLGRAKRSLLDERDDLEHHDEHHN